jgi:hypothetical protein
MKVRTVLFLIFDCLLLIGCPSYSVHPLYTDQDAVVEPALEGTWSSPDPSDKEEIVFQKSGDHDYNLAIFHPDTKVSETYKVHLVRLGGQLFMDLIANDQTIAGANLDGPMGVVAMHVILKVKISGDDLAYATLEDDAIRKQHTSGGAPLEYQMADGGVLVTAQTDALRRYISVHTEDVFSKFEHMKRKEKASVQP